MVETDPRLATIISHLDGLLGGEERQKSFFETKKAHWIFFLARIKVRPQFEGHLIKTYKEAKF